LPAERATPEIELGQAARNKSPFLFGWLFLPLCVTKIHLGATIHAMVLKTMEARSMSARNVFALLLLLAPLPGLGAAALALPAQMLSSTNKLQRAVWACEAGGQALSQPEGEQGTRFFLGLVAPTTSQAAKPPLRLFGGRLSGFGQISNRHRWLNIRFDCALRPDLLQAARLKFTVLRRCR
jgi:hypothetical protein